MASITPVFRADEFDDPYLLSWCIHPQRGQFRSLPRDVDRSIARYLFDEATIELDLAGPSARVSQCSSQLFGNGFALGDGVLLGDNLPGRMPVHLLFPTPMRSIGAAVCASGAIGQSYQAQCFVLLSNGQWHAVPAQPGTLRRAAAGVAGAAPLMGAIASADCTIVEAWFDVFDPANRVDFNQVAINDLFFLPA